MDLLTLLTLAVGLSMDAFAVGKRGHYWLMVWRLSGIDANHWIFSWNTI